MFFENDRTFCSDEDCERTECYRHQANVVGKPRFLSLADFRGTLECVEVMRAYNLKKDEENE